MKFEIDFNKHGEENDELLIKLGAKVVPTGSKKFPPFEKLEIELKSFEDLEDLLNKIEKETGELYSAIIDFDPPTIFLEK